MSSPRARSASPTRSASGRPVSGAAGARPRRRPRSRCRATARCAGPSRAAHPAAGSSSSASTMLAGRRCRPPGRDAHGGLRLAPVLPARSGTACSPPWLDGRRLRGPAGASERAGPRRRGAAGTRAQAASPSRSAAPRRHSGPVSSRISWSPRRGVLHHPEQRDDVLDLGRRAAGRRGRRPRREPGASQRVDDRRRTASACGTAPRRCGGARPRGSSQCSASQPATWAGLVLGRLAAGAPRPRRGPAPGRAAASARRPATRPQRRRRRRWRRRGSPSSLRQLVDSGSTSARPAPPANSAREARSASSRSRRASRRSTGCGSPTAVTGTGLRRRRRTASASSSQLGLGGVLELVEQHRPEPRPLGRADVGERAGQPRGEGHLVGEVHRVALRLRSR